MVSNETVIWAYRLLLGREPESESVIEHHSRASDVEDLRLALLRSPEFAQNVELLSRLPCIRNFHDDWAIATRKYYALIESNEIKLHDIREMYAAAKILEDPYCLTHLRRFYELFVFLNAHSSLLGRRCELLEIGTSGHTTPFYGEFFPVTYDTICRPIQSGGPDRKWAVSAGSRQHWPIDLDRLEGNAAMLAEVPAFYYDVVVCCEVVEHLRRAPRDLIAFSLSRLRPGGILYLTTPNFLTPKKLRAIYRGQNPSMDFSKYQENVDAHHHFREYTATELTIEVESVAGVAKKEVIFSNCWDYPEYDDPDDFVCRSNLVLVVNRSGFY